MKKNTIEIHSNIANHEVMKSPIIFRRFIDLLLHLSLEDTTVNIAGRVFICSRGEYVSLRKYWCNRWEITPKVLDKFFLKLEEWDFIAYDTIRYLSKPMVRISLYQYSESLVRLSAENEINRFQAVDYDHDPAHTEYQEPF